MSRHRAIVVFTAAAILMSASAAAQDSNFALAQRPASTSTSGWTFTPSLLYHASWDDNVLLRGRGDEVPRDVLNLVNPRVDLTFLGRRGRLELNYDGGFARYRQLTGLNSYEQHGTISARRLMTPHVALFVRNSAASVPTTELVQFIAVPFVRAGSRLDDLRGGIDAAFSKRTSMIATYDFQWVQFDPVESSGLSLLGGHSQGGRISLRHAISAATSLVAGYDIHHAIVVGGGTFDVQNADFGVEQKLSERTLIFAAAGVSRLGVSEVGPGRTGPAWRVGFAHQYEHATAEATYSRTYVPAFGFGGTYQNEELSGRLRMPLARRVYVQSFAAWRRNEPLANGDLRLKSLWTEATVGYAVQPWVHLEAFYSSTLQTIDRPGGEAGRNRIGFQIVTTKPLRIR